MRRSATGPVSRKIARKDAVACRQPYGPPMPELAVCQHPHCWRTPAMGTPHEKHEAWHRRQAEELAEYTRWLREK